MTSVITPDILEQDSFFEPGMRPWHDFPMTVGNAAVSTQYAFGEWENMDGHPEANHIITAPDGPNTALHFHAASQFIVVMSGVYTFPSFTLPSIGVYYVDHNTVYGGYVARGYHRSWTLRPRKSGFFQAQDASSKPFINRKGRRLHASENEVEWENVPDQPGARRKMLLSGGPDFEILEAPAGMVLSLPPAVHGRWTLIVKGSASINDKTYYSETLRYTKGTKAEAPLTVGEAGATFIIATYDADADWVFDEAQSQVPCGPAFLAQNPGIVIEVEAPSLKQTAETGAA